jgi:hypothetical protein
MRVNQPGKMYSNAAKNQGRLGDLFSSTWKNSRSSIIVEEFDSFQRTKLQTGLVHLTEWNGHI